jgi:hypothetical protein
MQMRERITMPGSQMLIFFRDNAKFPNFAITVPLFPDADDEFMSADEIDKDLLILVEGQKICCIVFFRTDFELIEKKREYSWIVISISSMPIRSMLAYCAGARTIIVAKGREGKYVI